jgi:RNA polymerase sigma-70 factor (ECF subfamily)
MKHLKDQELMKIIQAGDHSPASELYDRYVTRMYNFAFRFVRNAETAEDLTQEVFLKMITKAHTFKADSSLSTWLFTITANMCKDYLRKVRNHGEEETDEVLAVSPAPDEDGPERRFQQTEAAEAVTTALNKLSPDMREAVILARYGGLSYAEIATAAGCSEKAVKSRIHRAMDLMRNYLLGSAAPAAPEETNV